VPSSVTAQNTFSCYNQFNSFKFGMLFTLFFALFLTTKMILLPLKVIASFKV